MKSMLVDLLRDKKDDFKLMRFYINDKKTLENSYLCYQ